jgi:hypothetical protein
MTVVTRRSMKAIKITSGRVSVKAELNDSPTSAEIWKVLPLNCSANRWGDEIYFGIPVKMEEEPSAKADVNIGDLAYWAPGNAFCIFFGPTPASNTDKPRAASPVNLIGKISDDASLFRSIKSGSEITIERL